MGDAPRDPALAELPPVLATIAEAIGLPAALKLAATFGGVQISVSGRMTDTHPLAKLIGLEAAQGLRRLIKEKGLGDGLHRLWIPRAHAAGVRRRQRQVRDAVAQGASKRQTALQFGLTDRWVRQVCNRQSVEDERQGNLFETD